MNVILSFISLVNWGKFLGHGQLHLDNFEIVNCHRTVSMGLDYYVIMCNDVERIAVSRQPFCRISTKWRLINSSSIGGHVEYARAYGRARHSHWDKQMFDSAFSFWSFEYLSMRCKKNHLKTEKLIPYIRMGRCPLTKAFENADWMEYNDGEKFITRTRDLRRTLLFCIILSFMKTAKYSYIHTSSDDGGYPYADRAMKLG